uniref:Uncharacterized protein n=1 Tax=Arundo donax TaxID=35708 RepID=A0A0A8ZIV1_ARUDO
MCYISTTVQYASCLIRQLLASWNVPWIFLTVLEI